MCSTYDGKGQDNSVPKEFSPWERFLGVLRRERQVIRVASKDRLSAAREWGEDHETGSEPPKAFASVS